MICCWNSIEFFYHHYMTPLLPIRIFHSPLNGIWLNKVYSGAKLKSMQLIQYGWWFLSLFLNRTFHWNNLLKKSALVLSLDSVLEPYNIDNKEKFLFSDTCKEDPPDFKRIVPLLLHLTLGWFGLMLHTRVVCFFWNISATYVRFVIVCYTFAMFVLYLIQQLRAWAVAVHEDFELINTLNWWFISDYFFMRAKPWC